MFKDLFVAAQGGKGAAGRSSKAGQSKAKAFGGREVTRGGSLKATPEKFGGRAVTRERASKLTSRREK